MSFYLPLAIALAPWLAPSTAVLADDGSASADETGPAACFTLEPPDAAWRVLEPAELRILAPEALAGLAGPRGVKVVLHAGPDERGDLAASLNDELEAQGLLQSSVAFVEETEVAERQAMRGMVNGKRNGLWMRYHALVFREGPDLYRLVGWGRSEIVPADGSTFEEATAGLRRLEGVTLDLLPRGGIRADADGPGWRVREGIYRDGALGFELDPRGPWRVGLGSELGPLSDSSHVGLVDEQHDALFAVVVERPYGAARGPHAEDHRRQALGQAFGSGELEISAHGRTVALRLATVPAPPGSDDVTRQVAVGVLYERDLCVQVITRYPAASAKRMTKVLEQAFASLRVLDEAERAELAAELAPIPPAMDGVGTGWALRGGTWLDFARGLRWNAPAGFWEVRGVEPDDASQLATIARIHERRSGLRGSILAAPAADLDAEAWHSQAASELLEPESDGQGPPARVTLGEVPGLLSLGKLADGSDGRGIVVTCMRGPTALMLLLRGAPEVITGLSGLPQAAVAGLEVFETPLPPTEMAAGSYLDLRLGFELVSPDPAWSFHESKLERYGPTAAAADGVVAGFKADPGRGVFVAAAWTEVHPEEDGPLGPFVPSALRSLARMPDRTADQELNATLRGRPCRLLSWSEGGRRIELALLWRGNTALAVCAAGGPGDPDPRQWLAGFRLVD